MVRTQIQLTEQQAGELKRMARQRNVSVSSLIRDGVDQILRFQGEISWEERKRRALAMMGKYHSGRTDISERHDDYLVEIYGDYKK